MTDQSAVLSPAETAKRFGLMLLGSLFVQIFCWAAYSYLKMSTWFCPLSVLITAILYHFIQLEEQTGLSRKQVFISAILLPFLMSAGMTCFQLTQHRNLNLLGASLDGVSRTTETVSLYSARLLLNGVLLLIFAAADAAYLANHTVKEPAQHEE